MMTLSASVTVPVCSPDMVPATRTGPGGSGASGPLKKAQISVRSRETPSA